jgi:hypothetical protein
MQSEQALSNHVCLLITNIGPTANPKSKSCILEVTDGAYSLPVLIFMDKNPEGKDDRFDCDKILME